MVGEKTLWKIWKSLGMISNPIFLGKKKWHPNHQPANYFFWPRKHSWNLRIYCQSSSTAGWSSAPGKLRLGLVLREISAKWRMCPAGHASTDAIWMEQMQLETWLLTVGFGWIWMDLGALHLIHVLYSSYYSFVLSRRIISLHKQSLDKFPPNPTFAHT